MAIFTPGGGVAAVSGSVGGTTYSHNRGGPYMRTRAIPVNPGSVYQEAVRALMSQLTSLWQDTLTVAERAAWDTYALNVPLPNPLGQPRNVGGLGMYVRSNVSRLQHGNARIDDAPTIFDLGAYTPPDMASASESADTVSVTFDNTDAWAGEDEAALLVYLSRARGATINYHKGPYRYAGGVDGDSVTPPTSPVVINAPFPLGLAQRVFGRFTVIRADGRVGSDFRDFVAAS